MNLKNKEMDIYFMFFSELELNRCILKENTKEMVSKFSIFQLSLSKSLLWYVLCINKIGLTQTDFVKIRYLKNVYFKKIFNK